MPKAKGEILGVVIVESGWGSMLPTIVIANLCPAGPAARCGHRCPAPYCVQWCPVQGEVTLLCNL